MVLAAYMLLEHGTFKSHDKPYLALNILGSCGILASLYANWNLPSFVIQTLWIAISFYGIYKGKKHK